MAKQLFEQSFIDELNDRTNIVDLIGGYLPLKKDSRHNYKCCCPFHNEKTPSFYVDEDKNTFKCFGGSCGESGDPIGFLQKYSGLSFVEAVRELASHNGMQVPADDDDKQFAKFRRHYMEFNSRLHHHLMTEATTQAGASRIAKLPITEQFREALQLGTIIDASRMSNILKGASLSYMQDTLKSIEVMTQDGQSNLPTAGLYLPIKSKRGATLGFTFIDSKLTHYVLPESDMLKPEEELINIGGIERGQTLYVAFNLRDAVNVNRLTQSANILINPVGEAYLTKRQLDKVERATDERAVFVIPHGGNERHFSIASLLSEYDPLRPVEIFDMSKHESCYLLDHLDTQWSQLPDGVKAFYQGVAEENGKDYLLESIMKEPEKSRAPSPAMNG